MSATPSSRSPSSFPEHAALPATRLFQAAAELYQALLEFGGEAFLKQLPLTPTGQVPPVANRRGTFGERGLLALQAYQLAEQALERGLKDREAYEWLREEGPASYVLPAYATWCRYVRAGRRQAGESKNSSRYGRTGRSLIAARDQEPSINEE